MNLLEVVRKMKPDQIANSKSSQATVKMSSDSYNLHYIINGKYSSVPFEFNSDEWTADDWEIEVVIKWVDFWTAWGERSFKGKNIRSEYWHETIRYDSEWPNGKKKLTEEEIDGLWAVID